VIAALRLPARNLHGRAMLYSGGGIGLFAIAWLLPLVFFRPRFMRSWSFGATAIGYLPLLFWGAAVDAGQIFGGWDPIARHLRGSLLVVAVALIAPIAFFWKPILADYHLLKAIARENAGDAAGAKARFEKAWQLQPRNDRAAYWYSNAVASEGYPLLARSETSARAIPIFRKAIDIFPKGSSNYQFLARACSRAGKHETGVRIARQAIEIIRRNEKGRDGHRPWIESIESAHMTLITCLASEGSSASIREILSYLDTKEVGEVQVHAAKQLARIGAKEAIAPIRNLLENGKFTIAPEEVSREELREALRQLKSEEKAVG
jgi:tetratricopeptide (TPR) repeat protein